MVHWARGAQRPLIQPAGLSSAIPEPMPRGSQRSCPQTSTEGPATGLVLQALLFCRVWLIRPQPGEGHMGTFDKYDPCRCRLAVASLCSVLTCPGSGPSLWGQLHECPRLLLTMSSSSPPWQIGPCPWGRPLVGQGVGAPGSTVR